MSQQINLFNPALLKQKQVFTSRTMFTALGVLLAGGIAFSVVARHTTATLEAEQKVLADALNKAKLRQAQVMIDFAPRTKSAELQQRIDAAQASLRALQDIEGMLDGGALGGAQGYAEYLRALARQSSGDLWLTGLSIGGGDSAGIGLQGRALSADAVPAYVGRLAREPVLRGKTFGSLQISRPQVAADDAKPGTPPQDAPYIEFALHADGRPRAEVAP